jgi:hypothetical protein
MVIVALVVFVALLLPLHNGFTDDGFIHIQYAKNIITRGEYSFNPGSVSYGTTSPLWVMVLAALGRVFGAGDDLIIISRVLSWLAGLVAVVAMYRLGRALDLSRSVAPLCALALAGHAWHVRWTALSMETSSAVLCIIAVGVAASDGLVDKRRSLLLGLFMALASLVRPEAYLLVPVYLATWLTSRRRSVACLARTSMMYAALVGPWLVFARVYIGSFLPNTAGAKSGGLVLNPVVFIHKFEPIVKIVASGEGLFALLIVLSLLVLRGRARVLSERCRFALLWIIALPVAYVLFDIQVLSRYMLLITPFVIALGLLGLEDIVGSWWPRRVGAVAAAFTTVAVIVNAVFYFVVILPPSRAFSYDLTHRMKSMAIFLRDNSAPDAVVAAADIGYLAFYSQRHVLDLGGLVETVTHDLREQYDYEEIVDRGLYLQLKSYPRVDYFIDRVQAPHRFDGKTLAGYRFETILVDEIDNLGIRKPGPIYYTLYRLHREGDA